MNQLKTHAIFPHVVAEKILEKYKDDQVILDALFQFLSNPTSDKNNYRDHVNHIITKYLSNQNVATLFLNSDNKTILNPEKISSHEILKQVNEISGSQTKDTIEKKSINSTLNHPLLSRNTSVKLDSNKGIPIYLGTKEGTSEPVCWFPIHTPSTIYPVLGVIGSMGSGKTQTVKAILHEMVSNELFNVEQLDIGLLVFDFKGDYSGERRPGFLEEFNINEGLNVNPLMFDVNKHKSPYTQAVTVSEIFQYLLRLSSTQMANLRTAILLTYEKAGINKDDPSTFSKIVPPFSMVRESLQELVEEGRASRATFNALMKYLDPIMELDLFGGEGDPNYLNKKMVFNLTELPGEATPRIIVEFILHDIYRRMKGEGASIVNQELKQMRRILVIDEAHHILTIKGTCLEKILLEGRDFGTACILSSQYFEHFDGWERMISDFLVLKENQAGIRKNPLNLESKWLQKIVSFPGPNQGLFPCLYVKDSQRTLLNIPAYFKRIENNFFEKK